MRRVWGLPLEWTHLPALELALESKFRESGDSPMPFELSWIPGGSVGFLINLFGFFELTMVVVRGRGFSNFGHHVATVRGTAMHPGVAQYRNCWRWGHPTHACRAQGAKCQKCGGPHRVENHRLLAWCCKANLKSNPPREDTPAGTPCPHTFKCLNYKSDHSADNKKCPFWCHHFDKQWHTNKVCSG